MKKAQIFLFDGIIGFTLIVIALGTAFSYYYSTIDNTNIYSLNQQLMNSYSKTEINQLNDVEIREFFRNGYIKNIHNSIGQQTAEFYHTGRPGLAQNLTEIFVEDFITKQMNARILLENSTDTLVLFSKRNRNIDFEKASVTSVTKRSIVGFLNSNTVYNYDLTIQIWQ